MSAAISHWDGYTATPAVFINRWHEYGRSGTYSVIMTPPSLEAFQFATGSRFVNPHSIAVVDDFGNLRRVGELL